MLWENDIGLLMNVVRGSAGSAFSTLQVVSCHGVKCRLPFLDASISWMEQIYIAISALINHNLSRPEQ